MTREQWAEMTEEEQRIKVAELCGWKLWDHPDAMKDKVGWSMPENWCLSPDGMQRLYCDMPDYLNDLNACHTFKDVMSDDQKLSYIIWIDTVITDHYFGDVFATAAQRAEAFVLTMEPE